MSKAILYRMASGIPGDVSRMQSSIVEAVALDLVNAFAAYGVAGKMVSGKLTPLVANDTAASIYGLLVRPYPTSGTDAAGLLPNAANGFGNALRSGLMTVKNNAGTPAPNGQVYVRVATPATGKPIGGIEALSDVTVTGAAGSNTGDGTIGTLSATAAAATGAFTATMLTATTFRVTDPSGVRLKDGATGAAYTAAGVTFTITVGATPMVAGDSFTATIAPNTVPLGRSTFKSAADAAGNVEIEYKIG